MGRSNIPVPAESLRTIAESAQGEARRLRNEGYDSTARRLERGIGEAFQSLDAKDGEFVSISGHVVSGLTAHIDYSDENASRHANAAEVFLKQYGVWSNE